MNICFDEKGQVFTLFGLDTTNLQVKEMPASATIGDIKQYVGETTASYVNGYFYKYEQTTVSEAVTESLVVNQTEGITMGDFTTDINVFKSALNPDRTFTFQFSCVGKPKEISVYKFAGGMSFDTFTRDTVYDNSRLHYYSWVDGENNFYFTNTEIPNANTKFYPSSSSDITVPDSTPTSWEYISTTSRRTDDAWGMWIIGSDDAPIELSDYGLYSSSRGVRGNILQVTYTKPVNAVYNQSWQQKNVQPVFNLTSITGYDATKNQTLKNTNGVISWVDN